MLQPASESGRQGRSQARGHGPQGPYPAAVDQGEDEAETQEALAEYAKASADAASGTTKLGALLREQLENRSE